MKTIIAGSRTAKKSDVRKAIGLCSWANSISKVVSGMAAGADKHGEKWAEENKIEVIRFPAEWKKYGKSAGHIRNKIMAKNAEGLIAIWDGKSRGTFNMIILAKEHGLRIFLYYINTGMIKEYN